MAIYAVVENNVVTNMVEWDGSSPHGMPGTVVLADENTYRGGGYDGTDFARDPNASPADSAGTPMVDTQTSAINKLKALGLTEEEITIITTGKHDRG